MQTQTLNASAAQSFFLAAQGPQAPKRQTAQERADRALANQYGRIDNEREQAEKPKSTRKPKISSDTPRRAKDGYVWGEKLTALLFDENREDPRWMTEGDANLAGGLINGIRKQSGVKPECRHRGVSIVQYIPTENKKGEVDGGFNKATVYFNIDDCWGVRLRDGGTLSDNP